VSISVLLSPAPGWYPDPAGLAAYRWWDGDTWTEGTHAGVDMSAEPGEPVEPAPAVSPAPAAALVAEFGSALKPPIKLFADETPAVAPLAAAEPMSVPPQVRPSSPAKTRWSSMLFAFPFVYPIVVGMIVALGYAGGAASSTVALIVIAAIAAVGGIVPAWVFADNDRRELRARGYEPAPSIAWMLVIPPIAYLLARRRVVGPSY